MRMEITIPEADQVEARYEGLVIRTGQDGSLPAPFDLFLASIGTCAGFYVARFCQQRGIPTRGLRILQETARDPVTRLIQRIDLTIELPEGFPEAYRDAVVRAAGACTVKKHLASPPRIAIAVTSPAPSPA